ncbi:hypothetical protein Bbelb_257290 [Branchiostoma belcheri]|nr:hypothetical protein Bbelb_257290 [Branchiostoma belcheri]
MGWALLQINHVYPNHAWIHAALALFDRRGIRSSGPVDCSRRLQLSQGLTNGGRGGQMTMTSCAGRPVTSATGNVTLQFEDESLEATATRSTCQLTFDPSESPQSQAVPGYEILLKSRTVKPVPGADLGADQEALSRETLQECDKSLEVAAAWFERALLQVSGRSSSFERTFLQNQFWRNVRSKLEERPLGGVGEISNHAEKCTDFGGMYAQNWRNVRSPGGVYAQT